MFRLFLLCSIAVLFSFCTSENANTNQSNDTTETPTASANSTTPAAAPVKRNYEASHEAPFCKLWVVKYAAEVENRADYKGLWFDLKTDGSFQSGRYAEQSNGGTWSIEKETNIIRLQFNTPETIPSNWQIQGSGGGGRILWKGNVPGNPKGAQVMLEPENQRPTAG